MAKIWMIDDSPPDLYSIAMQLEFLDPYRKFEECTGFRNEVKLLEAIPDGDFFDDIDYALVDLQLANEGRASNNGAFGGQLVLPLLRQRAPWLPVAALSAYFNEQTLRYIPTIGTYDFDGMISKECFTKHDNLTSRIWYGVVKRITENAFLRNSGFRFANSLKSSSKVLYDGKLQKMLSEMIDEGKHGKADDAICSLSGLRGLSTVLQQLFRFGVDMDCSYLVPGASGAVVFKSIVQRQTNDGLGNSAWIVKMSKAPSRLWREVNSHLNVMRSGIAAGLFVPLLFNSVVKVCGFGMIVYQCAPSMKALDEHLNGELSDLKLRQVVLGVKQLHQTPTIRRVRVLDLAKNVFVQATFPPFQIYGQSCVTVEEIFCALLHSTSEGLAMSMQMDLNWSFIHGDLHARNILIGENVTLIDFSRAKDGPVVFDLAKLCCDIFIEHSHLVCEIPSWDNLMQKHPPIAIVIDLLNQSTKDDVRLFDIAMVVQLLQARSYYQKLIQSQSEMMRIERAAAAIVDLLSKG